MNNKKSKTQKPDDDQKTSEESRAMNQETFGEEQLLNTKNILGTVEKEQKENTENQQDEGDNSIVKVMQIMNLLSNFIDKETITQITDKIIKHQEKKSGNNIKIQELKLQVGEKNSSYFEMQYWQDIVMVFLVLLTIGILSYCKLMEASTTGTLMGSVIGYALGQFRERYRPKN